MYCMVAMLMPGSRCRRRSFTADLWRHQVVPRCWLCCVDGSKHCFRSCQARFLWSNDWLV